MIAYLAKTERYSTFSFGDITIKFKTSPYLLRYEAILKWNNGYIECIAVYSTLPEPVEEYIDLQYIALRLELPEDAFSGIEEVKIA